MSDIPVIDQERCNGCGLCITVCACKSLVLVGNVIAFIETGNCGWCTWCEAVCPTGAINCPFEVIIEER